MPIKIPDHLPAANELQKEGVPIIRKSDAIRQDIRPIKIALLNLMPLKEKTETQFARLLGFTPLQVELTFLHTTSYQSKNVHKSHLDKFYKKWDDVKDDYFDGFIITGAPVELLPFESVQYWDELKEIFHWTQKHVYSNFFVCWGAQAAIYYYRNIGKHTLKDKAFGIYEHDIFLPNNPFIRGFTDSFPCPVSRHTEVQTHDIATCSELNIIAASKATGACLVEDKKFRALYMFNHLEYDRETLAEEYYRDKKKNQTIQPPCNYFLDEDDKKLPFNSWRSHAHLLISNWINHIYQETPFDITKIGKNGA